MHISDTRCYTKLLFQFVIFKPWKVLWNWIAFSQYSFVISPGLLYHLIRRDSGRLVNEAFTSNLIVSLKEKLNSLKITNWFWVKSFKNACEILQFSSKITGQQTLISIKVNLLVGFYENSIVCNINVKLITSKLQNYCEKIAKKIRIFTEKIPRLGNVIVFGIFVKVG